MEQVTLPKGGWAMLLGILKGERPGPQTPGQWQKWLNDLDAITVTDVPQGEQCASST